jgi:hypothetical protein
MTPQASRESGCAIASHRGAVSLAGPDAQDADSQG